MQKIPQNVNFLSGLPQKSSILTARLLALGGLGLITILMLISFKMAFNQIDNYWQIKKVNSENVKINENYTLTAYQHPLLASMIPLAKQNDDLKKKLREKQSEFEAISHTTLRRGFSPYLLQLSEGVPDGLWLEKFTIDQQNKQFIFSGFLIKPKQLSLFFKSLYSSQLYQGQTFDVMEINTQKEAVFRSFTISNKLLLKAQKS